MAAALLPAFAACPGKPQVERIVTPPTNALGFADLASAEQLAPWWEAMGGARNVARVWLAPDRLRLVLELRHPVSISAQDGAAIEANAVLLDRSAGVKPTPLNLPGRILAADQTVGKLELHMAGTESSAPIRGFDLATQELTQAPEPQNTTQPDGLAMSPGQLALSNQLSDMLAQPDVSGGGTWEYFPALDFGDGTGRPAGEARPAQLRYRGGEFELAADPGTIPVTQLAGNIKARRAVLVAPGAGLLLADFKTDEAQLSWLLRDSGTAGLYLQPQADALVTAGPDGLRVIGLAQLVELAPRLAIGQQLSAEQTQRLKPALEALGWSWDQTQFSPLGGTPGAMSLFDTADLASATSELDWDAQEQHARHLLIARLPRSTDEALRQADVEAREKAIKALLALLGWPEARRAGIVLASADVTEAPTDDAALSEVSIPGAKDEETVEVWQLDATGAAGEFRLWLTPTAAVWELSSNTAQEPHQAAPLGG